MREREALRNRGLKLCSRCRRTLAVNEFNVARGEWDGLAQPCRACSTEYSRLYQDRLRANDPEYQQKRQSVFKHLNEKYPRSSADKRRSYLWRRYRITPDDFDLRIRQQNGLCAICGKSPAPDRMNRIPLHVDHVRGSYTVRGLLCSNCNRGIGCLMHDPELLVRALRYLRASDELMASTYTLIDTPTARKNERTFCVRGHPFTPENTYQAKTGRICKTCRREHERAYKMRRRNRSE